MGQVASFYAPHPPALEPLLSVSDAARALAVSRRTIYRLIAADELHPVRVGSRLRLERDDLRAYLERQRGGP